MLRLVEPDALMAVSFPNISRSVFSCLLIFQPVLSLLFVFPATRHLSPVTRLFVLLCFQHLAVEHHG